MENLQVHLVDATERNYTRAVFAGTWHGEGEGGLSDRHLPFRLSLPTRYRSSSTNNYVVLAKSSRPFFSFRATLGFKCVARLAVFSSG